jgi:hypothetical protein
MNKKPIFYYNAWRDNSGNLCSSVPSKNDPEIGSKHEEGKNKHY